MTTAALSPRFAQLRLRDLMLLEHVDELGSLTEAASRLHVTQSAVTPCIRWRRLSAASWSSAAGAASAACA